MLACAVVHDALSPDFPPGVELEVFIRREDAERFIEEVNSHEPELAKSLRIEEREQYPGGITSRYLRVAPAARASQAP